ncbi:MAG: hypothetical protein WBN62_14840, partial [Thermoanaerobaculia bacterium]
MRRHLELASIRLLATERVQLRDRLAQSRLHDLASQLSIRAQSIQGEPVQRRHIALRELIERQFVASQHSLHQFPVCRPGVDPGLR